MRGTYYITRNEMVAGTMFMGDAPFHVQFICGRKTSTSTRSVKKKSPVVAIAMIVWVVDDAWL